MTKRLTVVSALAGASLIAFIPGATFAQAANPAPSDDDENNVIIVTGTSVDRSGFDTPLSVTAFNSEDLARTTGNSQADILATIPGIKAEGGGGEVASNVQVRGLPSSGQYQFTPLEYDGMPVLSTFGLNSSAFDVYARNDLGIERLEFVAGGVSNLFGPGSVAGIINYVSKTGGPETEGIVQAEWADKGRVRGDFALSGPLGGDNYFALSGYYRYDEGPLKSGLPTEGYQIRGNMTHEFADGNGEVRILGQYIDDRVQFFLPLPLNGSTLERVNGADGETVYTVNTAEARNLTSILPDGSRYNTRIEDGVSAKGGTIGLILQRDLTDSIGLNVKTKWSRYEHQFNLFLDGDGIINVPETQAGYLTNRSITGPASFTYAGSGQTVAAGTLLFANRILNRDRPVTDFSAEASLTYETQTGGMAHNFTLGTWFARAEADDNNLTQTYLAEFSNAPRLVNLTAGGVAYTRNGLVDPSVGYSQNTHSAKRYAVYLADQMQADRLSIDVGLRVEHYDGAISREGTSTFTVAQGSGAESAALSSATYGNGSFLQGDVASTEWAASIGALYNLTDDVNIYANFSRGFFFPEIRSVGFNSLGNTASYEGEIIKQAEAGVKFNSGGFRASVAAFWSELSNRRSVTFTNTTGGGVAETVTTLSSKAVGFEATGSYNFTSDLSFDANVTFADHEISASPNAALVGKELERKPNWFANAGLVFDNDAIDANVSWNYQSDAFANNLNTVSLPAYSLVRAGIGYTLPVGDDEIRIGASVFNLFNSQGLAEGSPRIGSGQTAGGQFFVGRPILPRRFTITASYKF